ncbi:hypothetical protein HDU79_002405 [Rhizoclosmatium sp. JEL0117]|nr:hypothetical protein HDU99_000321 [Rhizoclosmatium hyalinum]KAJ3291409.1 hypothetical protein HDU79_002405 [Rhizoclosmatium sp. JEL0117]
MSSAAETTPLLRQDSIVTINATSSQSTLCLIDDEDELQQHPNGGPKPFRDSDLDSHIEPHFAGAEIVRDVVVGLSDGLTVPFALSAGLASLGNSRFVVLAGMAEIVAGAISMGLGGYLAGRSEIEHYDSEYIREETEVREVPERELEEIVEIFEVS